MSLKNGFGRRFGACVLGRGWFKSRPVRASCREIRRRRPGRCASAKLPLDADVELLQIRRREIALEREARLRRRHGKTAGNGSEASGGSPGAGK